MGHVNNAAYWAAVEHRLAGREPDLRDLIRAGSTIATRSISARTSSSPRATHGGRYGAAFVVGDVVKAVVWVEPLGS